MSSFLSYSRTNRKNVSRIEKKIHVFVSYFNKNFNWNLVICCKLRTWHCPYGKVERKKVILEIINVGYFKKGPNITRTYTGHPKDDFHLTCRCAFDSHVYDMLHSGNNYASVKRKAKNLPSERSRDILRYTMYNPGKSWVVHFVNEVHLGDISRTFILLLWYAFLPY